MVALARDHWPFVLLQRRLPIDVDQIVGRGILLKRAGRLLRGQGRNMNLMLFDPASTKLPDYPMPS